MRETKSKKVVAAVAEKPKKKAAKENAQAVEPIQIYGLEPLPEKVKELPPTEFSSEAEVSKFIGSLIKMSKYRTALEIGVFKGETSIHIIDALPNAGQYLGIDIGDYRSVEAEKAMQQGGKAIDFILGDSLNELTKLLKQSRNGIDTRGNRQSSKSFCG